MNKQAKLGLEILFTLVTIVLTSAVVLVLVRADVLDVKPADAEVSLLNVEFLPNARQGTLAIKDFQFCTSIGALFNCVQPKNSFSPGDEVHFRFLVESSTVDNNVIIIENYKLLDAENNVLLDVDQKNNYHFETISNKQTEEVIFTDYFTIGSRTILGEYTLQLILSNPLLNKQTSMMEGFEIR